MTEIATQQYFLLCQYLCRTIEPMLSDVKFAVIERVKHLSELASGYGDVSSREFDIDALECVVKEVATIQIPFYLTQIHIPSFDSKATVFGKYLTLSDMGGVIQKIVSGDLVQLNTATKNIQHLDLWSVDKAFSAAKLFMESEVHQNAVNQCPKRRMTEHDFKALSVDLSRSLSHQYLEKTARTFMIFYTKAYAEYQLFGWLLATPILLLLMTLLVQSAHEIWALCVLALGSAMTHWLIKNFTLERFEKNGGRALRELISSSVVGVK